MPEPVIEQLYSGAHCLCPHCDYGPLHSIGYFAHECDAYRWVEYSTGHALFAKSEDDRKYWTGWFGKSMRGVRKGIAAISLPAELS